MFFLFVFRGLGWRVGFFCCCFGVFCFVLGFGGGYLEFVYVFSIVSHNILRLVRHRLDKWMVKWLKELAGLPDSQGGDLWYKV